MRQTSSIDDVGNGLWAMTQETRSCTLFKNDLDLLDRFGHGR